MTTYRLLPTPFPYEQPMKPHDPIPNEFSALVDAAICLYDAVENLLCDANPRWDDWRGNMGAMSARQWCIGNAHLVENLWVEFNYDYDASFDFEFVPWVLETCIEWDGGNPMFRADSADIIRGLLALRNPISP